MSPNCQPGILAPVPKVSRYLEFSRRHDADPRKALRALAARKVTDEVIVGIGPAMVALLKGKVPGLHPFPSISGPGVNVVATQADLWIWLRGRDRGELVHTGNELSEMVAPAFGLDRLVDGFMFTDSRDLSGYEDGTENPKGAKAAAVAVAKGQGRGLDGSSYVAVQQWLHDLGHLHSLSPKARDNIVGRRQSDNEEFASAPKSAHVKRAAQESFSPEAFMLRRSMPWADDTGEGLVFVAFGKTLDAYEAVLRRMTGQEDGIVDGLFRFTRPISGSYFWCPPVKGGKLDLSAIGL